MRIDLEYVKELLEIFLESDLPTVDLKSFPFLDLRNDGDESQHKFVFHMEILHDQDLIEAAIPTPSGGIGINRLSGGGFYTFAVIPLRLTAAGHDFAAALDEPGVLEKLMRDFKDDGPTAVVSAAGSILKKIVEKKLTDLAGD